MDGVLDVGSKEGIEEGVKVGAMVVCIVGARDGGTFDGIIEGDNVGAKVGIDDDGNAVQVGNSVGLNDCITVGSSDGDKVGIIVGLSDDNADGEYDEGETVGTYVFVLDGSNVGLYEGCCTVKESATHTKANKKNIIMLFEQMHSLLLIIY